VAVRFSELDLSERLTIARRGTAYFAQRQAELTDEQLHEPTALAGWSRAHLVAHVGYNAAALCRLMDWAASGIPTPMYASTELREQEIAEGATLSGAALRNLFTHTVARLDKKWRNLPESAWSSPVQTAQRRTVPASESAWMRTREVRRPGAPDPGRALKGCLSERTIAQAASSCWQRAKASGGTNRNGWSTGHTCLPVPAVPVLPLFCVPPAGLPKDGT
jgi:uncharacterized protein (TIGR03083 family)